MYSTSFVPRVSCQAPRNPPQGLLSCFHWSRDQNGPQDNQGAGPRSHRARHTVHVTWPEWASGQSGGWPTLTPRTSRDQNGPQDNPGAGLRSHRAGTGSSAGQPFFCCRAASPVLGSVGLCGPSRDPCRGGSQVPPAAIWGCLRRPRGRNAARLGLGSGSGRYVLFGARFEAQTAVRRTETET